MTLLPALLAVLLGVFVPGSQDDEFHTRRLQQLFQEYDQWQRREFPEDAMSRGDYTHADRITDNSLAAFERRNRELEQFLSRLRLIDQAKVSEDDRLSYQLLEVLLDDAIQGHRFRAFLAPIGTRFGPQQSIPQMGERVRFDLAEDYENYLKRLELAPRSVRNTIELMRVGLDEGRVPPRVALDGVVEQIDTLLEGQTLERLAEPLASPPDQVTAEQVQMWEGRLRTAALPAVREALGQLRLFLVDTYLPGCRESIAAVDWPDGEAYYAHQLRVMTTTDLTAEEIHARGLAEVARIRGEMMKVIRSSNFMSLEPAAADLDDEALFSAFIEYLRTDPRFYYRSEQELLDRYRVICKIIDGHMPRFFARLPRLPYGVKAIPQFMAARQTTAYYQPGDIRNAQAGYFFANTFALDQRPTYEMIALALHEAVPGHHHQVALAKEIDGLPEFRREAWFTAFGEGWALYAERLGIEMGLFEDPYDDFGRLLYEMWRACRLVVDPGMHTRGWSRQQAIDFMLENTALSELNIANEVDRYIAWPGQACAYKIGEMKIRELRIEAERLLGKRFDLRGFHDAVLGDGSVPLTVLESKVRRWINRERLKDVVYD
jgi:uncharacterized protein (DUF885 family)